MEKENCIICNKEIPKEHMGLITCSKECSKIYNRISSKVYNYMFKPRRCLICFYPLDLEVKKQKRLICLGECSDLFDKIVNRISKKEENANTIPDTK